MKWVKCEDKLPEMDQDVFIRRPDGIFNSFGYRSKDMNMFCYGDDCYKPYAGLEWLDESKKTEVEFAIRVLEELAKECRSDFGLIVLKITELKKLLP